MRKSRKDKATELLKLIGQGPSYAGGHPSDAQVRLWLSTWILPLVEDLVPEARGRGMLTCASHVQHPIPASWSKENVAREDAARRQA